MEDKKEIVVVSSGDVKQDFKDFYQALKEKYQIQNELEFLKDFDKFLTENISKKFLEKEFKDSSEEMEKISNAFFSLIKKHSKKFSFEEIEEEAKREVEALKGLGYGK